MDQKVIIANRKKQQIAVLVEPSSRQQGLVFVMHGLGGFKEQDHIKAFADSFRQEKFTVVCFDTTNTLGKCESGGKYENATITNYFEDLEDVIEWASSQKWYEEPFWLVGHSLGGISTILFTEKYPSKIKALAPVSTVVSGKLSLQSPRYSNNDILETWERTGWRSEESKSQPGLIKRLKWSHMVDRLKYDVLDKIDKITMPVLLIVGDQDESTPIAHQKILFNQLISEKEIHIIKDGPHTFKDEKQLIEIKAIFSKWIRKVQNTSKK